jgi:dTDP-4-dehydrorhamnose reductase
MLGTDLGNVLKHDFEIVGLERRPVTHLTVPYDICDLTQARKTRDAILGHKPDVIVHAAAMTDVDYCEGHQDEALENNVTATEHVVNAANEIDVPVIFFSTDYVFDGKKKEAYTEADTTNPVSYYGKTKRMAEMSIVRTAKRATILRISWLFGVWGRCFPKAILRQASEISTLNVVDDQMGCPTWTRDIAETLYKTIFHTWGRLLKPGVEIFHLGNAGSVHWADYARFILNGSGINGVSVQNISSSDLKRPAPRPANSVLSFEKFKKVFGIEMRSWEEATLEFLPILKSEMAAQEARTVAKDVEKENKSQ